MPKLDIIRSILNGEDKCMGRAQWQDPKIEIRSKVKRPFYFLRAYVPVITADRGLRRERKNFQLGFCDETTKRQAQEKKKEIMSEINHGRVLVKSQIPFGEIAKKFLAARVPKLGAATQAKYRAHIENHILPAFSKMRLVDIDAPTIEAWLNLKESDGLSWWTRLDLRNIMSAIFTKAAEWKMWERDNPCIGVDVGRKKVKREKKLLTGDDLRLLLAAVDDQMQVILRLAFGTGLRISEILGLKWSDFDFTKGTVTVSRRWHRGDMDEPKSESARRVRQLGPITDDLKPLAREASAWCFTDAQGDLYDDRDLLQHRLRPVAEALKIYFAGFGFHTFRRQNISWRQDAGAHPFEAQKAAGHAKASTTWDYTITDSEREKEQIGRMFDRLIGNGKVQ